MVIELVKENVCLVLQCVTSANTVCIRIAHNLSTLVFQSSTIIEYLTSNRVCIYPVNQILCGTVVRLSKLVKQGAQRYHEFYGQR